MEELEHKMGSWTEQLMTTMPLNPFLKDMEEIYQGQWKWHWWNDTVNIPHLCSAGV